MLSNCDVGEDSWESLGLQEDQPVNPKGINSEYSLMLKLKLQYFCSLIWRADSLEKTLMLGRQEEAGGGGDDRTRRWGGITDSMDVSLSKPQMTVEDREAGDAAVHGTTKSWTQLNNKGPYIHRQESFFGD